MQPAPVTRRRDGLLRREALLDAALVCCTRSSVLRVGIEEIRREAGASPSSVYNLFADLNALRLALLLRTFEQLFAHLTERVVGTRGARGAVFALVEAHLEWVLAHPAEARYMYQATALEYEPEAAARLQERKAALLAPVVHHVAPFVAAGDLPSWSVLALDVSILGASHEACRRYLAGAELDPAWMRRELPQLAWAGILSERRRARRAVT